ncbi:YkgJ family cysteine cluster protein [Planctomicrobium sp. SH661]|uniref:YkgJ family cysteine cluster protein n=1 Tax=Planctomicrobium sp. SH661 TaxID=3448124 RepID=UPI003F5B3975
MMNAPLPMLESCEGCGACCRTISAPPFRIDHTVNEPRERGVPQDLIDEFLPTWEVRFQVITDRPCLWFDEETLRCRHYDIRPSACREFELNSPSCIGVRHEYGPG